ncbi:carboxypeptidase regulatory-like domain-containing protein [Rhizobium sp. TH2]|uniref:carboxypeptidase-like regulatory domain-containing protein n=1 Tax=Rhizobium sp. TH2 TaxID=2775403 RepID=UPI0021588EBE|nr:carboxypeptidase-like regulatory domain-containing protein [Rhizobium sp. TH2]UVC07683.1 carboxypeptidase regulatory-like domain-containing protein [Rhizobium sp. TH2]
MKFIASLAVGMALLCVFAAPVNAGTVSGRVTDTSGTPVFGVTVEVVYQTYNSDDLGNAGASIKVSALTNGDGRYTISTDNLPPGEYSANAYQVVNNGGREINIDFRAEDTGTFAGNADTIRNFTGGYYESSEENPYGNGGVFVVNNAVGDFTDLAGAEVTLINSATGISYVRTVRPTGEGLVVTGIPFGEYYALVKLNGRPLQLKLWGPDAPDEFSESVTHDFTMGWLGNQFVVAVKP